MNTKKSFFLLLIAAAIAGLASCTSGQVRSDFFAAVNSGNLDEIKAIAEGHPGVKNAYLNDGWTALTVAAREGNVRAVNLLIEEGVDVNKQEGGGNSALFWAVYYGHEEVVSALLRHGARVDNKCDKCQDPIGVAREKKYTKILELLEGK